MENEQDNREKKRRALTRAVLFVLFAVCIAVTVVFSVPGLIVFRDETLGKLLKDALPRLAVSAFLFFLLFSDPFYRKGLRMEWRRIPRALLWNLPCLAVALVNFPYSALLSGSAKIGRIGLLWLFLGKCLFVALLEELFFRALLVPFVRARIKGKLAAGWTVLLTAAVFSLSHLLNLLFGAGAGATLLQTGYTFLLGCMFAVMFLKTGNVWWGVLVHFLFDVGGFIVTDLGTGKFQDTTFWILTAVAGIVCAAHIVYTLVGLIRADAKNSRE